MKKLLIIMISLITAISGYSQVVDDGGPIIDPNYAHLRFALNGGKWNKTSLKYYIYNTSNNLTAAQRQSIIQTAFQRWAAVSTLSFTEVSSPSTADIKIKWATGNHGDNYPFNGQNDTLAHAYAPPPAGGSLAGEVHFNDNYTWIAEGSGSSGYSLLHTAIHEIGHALGISHTDIFGSIMWPYYTTQTTLGADDIAAIQALYPVPSITGPNSIPCSGTVTYTTQYLSSWTVSSNLQIMSGQGTNSITVKAVSSTSNGSSAWVSANGIVTKNVSIAMPPYITSISGPGTVQSGGYGTFYAYPVFPASEGEYEWLVSPNTVTMGKYQNMCDITFLNPGTYSVCCRSKNSCCSPGSYTCIYVTVSNSGSYSAVVSSGSKVVTVTYSSQNNAMQSSKQTVDYTLTNITTGATVAKGQLAASGGTLDFSAQPAGIYILQIETGSGTPETFKIVLK